MGNKPIAIGIENYKGIIDKPYLIGEILDKGGKVNLFTRPRLFGKNLALSMINLLRERYRYLWKYYG